MRNRLRLSTEGLRYTRSMLFRFLPSSTGLRHFSPTFCGRRSTFAASRQIVSIFGQCIKKLYIIFFSVIHLIERIASGKQFYFKSFRTVFLNSVIQKSAFISGFGFSAMLLPTRLNRTRGLPYVRFTIDFVGYFI